MDKKNNPSRVWRWMACVSIVLLILGASAIRKIQLAAEAPRVPQDNTPMRPVPSGLFPPEMEAARPTPKDVIGDLGGMKVSIPRHYPEFVEYNGDPGFGQRREGPIPERTFASKLRSFGMGVRFPDMKGLENAALRQEYYAYELNPESPWMRIGIDAGERYQQLSAKALAGQASQYWDPPERYWWLDYERLPGHRYGLEAYVLRGIDPKSGRPARASGERDGYVHRDATGQIDALITCQGTKARRCKLSFGLEPKAAVLVQVRFRESYLKDWVQIRESVRALFLSFEAKGTEIKSTETLNKL